MTPLSPQSPQSPSGGGGDALNSSGEQERSDEDGSLDVVIPSPVQSPEVSLCSDFNLGVFKANRGIELKANTIMFICFLLHLKFVCYISNSNL